MNAVRIVAASLAAALCFTVLVDAADAKRRKKRGAPPSVSLQESQRQCDGGVLITADDQVKGCTIIIRARVSRLQKSVAHYNRGNALFGKSLVRDAIADYDRALELQPQYVHALYNRAIARRAINERAHALADLDSYLAMSAEDSDARLTRGTFLLELGRVDAAERDASNILSRRSEHQGAILLMAHLSLRRGDVASAARDYELVLARAPTNAEALYGLGLIESVTHKSREGLARIQMAQALDVNIDQRMNSLGLKAPATTTSAAPSS